MSRSSSQRHRIATLGWVAALGLVTGSAMAADHIDFPQSVGGGVQMRPDAQITDFYIFVSGTKLVMVMDLHPFMAPAGLTYTFPTDVHYRFNVDLNSAVTIGTDVISKEFGGVISNPAGISEDMVFDITFNANNKPTLNVTGANSTRCEAARVKTRLFTGLRGEPFIFSSLVRNNVASIIVELPLNAVVQNQSKLLAWATATVDLPSGSFQELGARAFRSQFPPYVNINALHPSQHVAAGFAPADVVIIDTSKPTAFPNGRALSDDVVDIVATFVSLPTDRNAANAEIANCAPGGADYPCPVPVSATADDVRILGRFPYVGRPYTSAERAAPSSAID
jgi:hypothetical protein